MPADLQKARELFLYAVGKLPPEQWDGYVAEACGADADLKQQVRRLLQVHREAGSFLDRPAAAVTVTGAFASAPWEQVGEGNPRECAGTVIGPYKLLQQIGEGGMGTVFMAEQTTPVQRKVALKVVNPGMDSRQIIARFEAERQALAMMDHVNIARVLDAGATRAGRPYFVMELVHGVPITKYCDDNCLTPRQRLELFVPVCQAIQHAHQKGIIHRDIKPSNVMITLYDGKPVPKVIDFGVAKATEQPLTERTLFTLYGTMVGTLEYMSPEQAELSALGVDTRSDIYSLGVLLYELLTGSTPLSRKRLTEAAYSEILHMIKEEEPPKPSARLSDSGDALASISARRHMEPAKLTRVIHGELDWIVMKTLEKDRNRRYATVNDFAADVQRYLNDEPVQACPASTWYRFRKLARRNKAALVAAAVTTLGVIAAVVGLAVSNALIRQEQARTRNQKESADKFQQLAQYRAEEIQRGLERLKSANTLLDRGRMFVAAHNWDDAYAAFTKAIQLRPDHVSLWQERGEMHTRLGLWDLAAADIARETELRAPETTWTSYQHAILRSSVGDREGYNQTCRRMRARFRGTTNELFARDVVRACVLGPAADVDLDQLVELAQSIAACGPGDACPLYILGIAHYRAGQYEEAGRRLRESMAIGPGWAAWRINYPVLAMAHHRLGQAAEARKALNEAAVAIDQWTGEPYQSGTGWNLGAEPSWAIPWWDWLECQLYFREAKVLIDGAPPADDPRLHVVRARAFAALRWSEKAGEEYDAALKLHLQDPRVRVEAHRNWGYRCTGLRQWREAAAEFAKASELQPEDSYLWRYRAVAHFAAGDAEAYRQTCAAMLERFEKTEDRTAAGNVLLACVLRQDALPRMDRLLSLTRVADPIWHWGTWARGAALYRAGQYDQSVRCFEIEAKTFRRRAWEWCFLCMAHHRLGHADEARHCLAEAARWIDEANRHEGDDWSGTQAAWGGWHDPVVSQLLFREAETLLGEKESKQ
jgi:serine/threonine protein kinase/tetratricopeptide (TPR) repeat protein